ncbi:MAG: TPM domain-containing protein [Chitinophagaceae bacterium]|nr:TPM domain-containing protein [Chitinophagaceae bacterium]
MNCKNDRKLNIATGYGLEGALPDLTSKQIIDNIIVPNFKGDDYYRGIEEGTDAIIQAVKGEYKAPANYNKEKG